MDGYAIENLGLYIFLQIRIAGVKSKQVMFALTIGKRGRCRLSAENREQSLD